MHNSSKTYITNLLNLADININGTNPWDIQIKNENFYQQILAGGSMAVGESYMDEWWDVPALDQFFYKIFSAHLDEKIKNWKTIKYFLIAKLFNQQTTTKSLKVGKEHYDIGNELYQLMLDPYMCYSCGYWKSADNLNQAQIDKLERSCQKLKLKPGMKVLDIGCGWGSFAKYAAEKYDVEVVGVNNSARQVELAKKLTKGLKVDIKMLDYRKLTGKFDRIISIGMFEHVGYKNYKTYMNIVNKLLKPKGLFLLHTIGRNFAGVSTDPWIDKYIFPNGMLPAVSQISRAS